MLYDCVEILAVRHLNCPSLRLQHLMIHQCRIRMVAMNCDGCAKICGAYTYQWVVCRLAIQVCRGFRNRAIRPFLMRSSIQVKCPENQSPAATCELATAMGSHCMDSVDTIRSRRPVQIRPLPVRRPDFSISDLSTTPTVPWHSCTRLQWNMKNIFGI